MVQSRERAEFNGEEEERIVINFPVLSKSSFVNTRMQFHSVAEVIGKFREVLVTPIAKNDNLYLNIVEQGFCTPPIGKHNDLEIGCNPGKRIVEIGDASGKYTSINLNGITQKELAEEVKNYLSTGHGLNAPVDTAGFDSVNTYSADDINSGNFLVQLVNFHLLLKGFWKRINSGVKSPIYLWPHHFDNAFKWFSGRKVNDEDEQMGIGVSNGDDSYSLPYIYMTFWPPLGKTNTLKVPEGGVLYDAGWTGMIMPYESVEAVSGADKQTELINNFFDTAFESVTGAFSKR